MDTTDKPAEHAPAHSTHATHGDESKPKLAQRPKAPNLPAHPSPEYLEHVPRHHERKRMAEVKAKLTEQPSSEPIVISANPAECLVILTAMAQAFDAVEH